MKLQELKDEVSKYQHFEDTSIIDIAIASIVANRMKLGDPVWLIIIGVSSGGKSQILRPLSLSKDNFIHRIDDLTENTFLSGMKAKEGDEPSLLIRIGPHGIIVISDFTVIMSKSKEARAAILSQLRMVYDGEMTKHSGSSINPITWNGYMGVVAGSTPSVYAHFEEVADMGERFVYYRMKEVDPKKAMSLALNRTASGKELDDILAPLYDTYIGEVINSARDKTIELSDEVKNRIMEVSSFAERVRTVAHKDWKGEKIDRIPQPAMPVRVALQMSSLAKGLGAMQIHETGTTDFTERQLKMIDWMGYSLANEEKRACLKVLASVGYHEHLTTATIADHIGLDTTVIRQVLQNLSAVGVLNRSGDEQTGSLKWHFAKEEDHALVRRIEHMTLFEEIQNREASSEEDIAGEYVDNFDDLVSDLNS